MRAVLTRVSRASLTIDGQPGPSIDKGLLVLLGIKPEDERQDAEYLAEKCSVLRIFEDENGKMNRSVSDVGGSIMVVSNFTLYADCSRGRRPDFFGAAKPDIAIPLYEHFIDHLKALGMNVCTGKFGSDMKIDHVNDGPVTVIMESESMRRKK